MASPLEPAQRAFLEQRHWSVLATINPNGSPQLSVMWYLLDGDEILLNTAAGRQKTLNLARDSRVTLAVFDEDAPTQHVVLSGRARRSADGAQAQADVRRLAERYTPEARLTNVFARFALQQRVSYRITIRRVRSQALPV